MRKVNAVVIADDTEDTVVDESEVIETDDAEDTITEVKPEKPLFTLTVFPEIDASVITARILDAGKTLLNASFDRYLASVSSQINPKALVRVTNKINRIRATRLKNLALLLEGYAIDISALEPNVTKV
jgi:hypothetical protein